MNWLEKMNAALGYIEENLTEKMDYETVAQKACCSVYQFQRLFSFITDVPLAEYIRRRRLTLAAFELQSSDKKVLEIALCYGYESPEAFARAFQALHGVTPTMARNLGVHLKAYPRITFQISIKGDVEMEYRIEKKQAFAVNGISREFDMADEGCFQEIPKLWNTLCAAGELEKMMNIAGVKCDISGCLLPVRAASYSASQKGTKFCYMIGIADETEKNIPGYTKIEISEGTWAVFTSEECEMNDIGSVIQKLNKRIYGEWLPTSNYEMGNINQELYYRTTENKTYCEIWIMVKPSAKQSE